MPELPEVETQRRSLEKNITRLKITEISTDTPKIFIGGIAKFRKNLINREIIKIDRKGKFLIFELKNKQMMIAHFRMTGHFLLNKKGEFDNQNCIRAIFKLNNGQELLYQDIRKFGRFWAGEKKEVFDESGIDKLGFEPLEKELSFEQFLKNIKKHKSAIKPLLLNQKFIAGIGNIYADEALFLAKIHPLRKTNTLNKMEIKALRQAIINVIKQGIKNHGTTIGEYVDAENKQGKNQNYLYAYKRDKKPCRICGTKMQRIVVAQRGTTFCPRCQKYAK